MPHRPLARVHINLKTAGRARCIRTSAKSPRFRARTAGAAYTAAVRSRRTHAQHRMDVCKRGTRCNAICPSATITNIAESMPQDRLDRAFAAFAPTYLQPQDITNVVLFLASDKARNMNGTIIPADGSWGRGLASSVAFAALLKPLPWSRFETRTFT